MNAVVEPVSIHAHRSSHAENMPYFPSHPYRIPNPNSPRSSSTWPINTPPTSSMSRAPPGSAPLSVIMDFEPRSRTCSTATRAPFADIFHSRIATSPNPGLGIQMDPPSRFPSNKLPPPAAYSAGPRQSSPLAASPIPQRSLPSIHDQLGNLAGLQLPLPNGRYSPISSLRSPPIPQSSTTSRLQNSSSNSYFPSSHPSPPSTLSGYSPSTRTADSSTTSPSLPFGKPGFRDKPISPTSDITTPMSSTSSSSFNSGVYRASLAYNIGIEGRPTLPSLSSAMSSLDSRTQVSANGQLTASQLAAGQTGYTCDFTGCNAVPFQTQYLLNSHANVHSSSRPHYCPRKGCPRSEGGKGFKRKNEMIRHGLVHQSPGYACPFCPEREHKYPRPDNLQRHVKVHHVDRDKEDPELREVLSQRVEGGKGAGRRRVRAGG